jgi:putative lipoic acid-binding regulatory protein
LRRNTRSTTRSWCILSIIMFASICSLRMISGLRAPLLARQNAIIVHNGGFTRTMGIIAPSCTRTHLNVAGGDKESDNEKDDAAEGQIETNEQQCAPKKKIVIRQPVSGAPSKTPPEEQQAPKNDMSQRFKYSVNALMGAFDPPSLGENNTERDDGNILNAMLLFPTKYTFTAVGRTNGDSELQEQYTQDVTNCILQATGDKDDMIRSIKPRGAKFTRVSVEVMVDSSTLVSGIYEALGNIEATVMKY